jgi:hypothetical protein
VADDTAVLLGDAGQEAGRIDKGDQRDLLSSTVFRNLIAIEPFRSAGPIILSVPAVRRRIFSPYVKRLRGQLTTAREQSISESYVDLPVRILSASSGSKGSTTASKMSAALCATNRDERCNILVEAPGGRGKSALLRRVVEVSLDAYQRNALSPLPILCYGVETDLAARIRLSLGTDGFPEEVLTALLRAGEFFLVIDGLAESAVTPAQILDHIARFGQGAPLLVAARPNALFRSSIQNSTHWWIAEPQRLSEATIDLFLQAYDCDPRKFRDSIRAACRNIDGEYLPILVRLAMLSLDDGPSSMTDVYRVALARLLKGDDALMDAAARVCYETYWKTGRRTVAFSTAAADRRAVLRKLLEVGLVVPIGARIDDDHEPAAVRFFHDSIQTYLTAVYLSRDRATWLPRVMEAAADERFSLESSDLFTTSGTELYQMCLITFAPPDEFFPLLVQYLRVLVDEHSGAFSRDWILETRGLPERVGQIDRRESGANAALAVIDMCEDDRNFPAIAALFARTALLLWTRIRRREKSEMSIPIRQGLLP